MKVWIRTRIADTRCGRCGTRHPKGTPMLVLAGGTRLETTGRAHWWTLLRCAKCAGEPAPTDVAALPDELPLPPGAPARVGSRRPTALDDKQRQLGGDQ